jgi:hypothetical protein
VSIADGGVESGDSSASDATPVPMPGGGVEGPELADELIVFVIDGATGRGVPNVSVEFDGTSAQTDADGRTQLKALAVHDRTLNVNASGYAPTTWRGIRGSVVTVPIWPKGYDAAFGILSGTFEDFQSFSPSQPGRYVVAIFQSSRQRDLDAMSTRVRWDAGEVRVCKKLDAPAPCNFSLRVPVSQHTVFAVVAEGDDQGTPDDAFDDKLEMVGLALGRNIVVTQDEERKDVRLELVEHRTLVPATIDPAQAPEVPPELTGEIVAVPGIDADDEVLLFDGVQTYMGGHLEKFLVPSKLSGLGNAKLWTVATWEHKWDYPTIVRSVLRGQDLPEANTASISLPVGPLSPPPSAYGGHDTNLVSLKASIGLTTFEAYAGLSLLAEGLLVSEAGEDISFPLPIEPDERDYLDRAIVRTYAGAIDSRRFSIAKIGEAAPAVVEDHVHFGTP